MSWRWAQPGARGAAALAGVAALRNLADEGSGIDAPMLSYAWVGVTMGLKPLAAGQRLRLASDAGWIRACGVRRGSAQAWKLRQLSAPARETAMDFSRTIDALADGDTTDPLASALLSVDSPVWSYSETLDHRSWLILVADAAKVDAGETYGLSQRTIRQHRLALSLAGLIPGPGLAGRLDALAREGGPAGEPPALAQWTAAEDRRRAEAAERKQAVLAVRAEKDAQHAAAQQAKDKARAARAKRAHPGVAAQLQTKRVPLPEGFDPVRHGAGLRTKVEATGWALKGVVLEPRDSSAPYAVAERAVVAA